MLAWIVAATIAGAGAGPAAAGWDEDYSLMSNGSYVLSVVALESGTGVAVGMVDLGGSQKSFVSLSSTPGSWNQVYEESSGLIMDAWFEDASTGFIGGLAMASLLDMGAFIRKTTDGGHTFTDVVIPESSGLLEADLVTDLYFTPGGTGFALTGSGAVWRSDDAGSSWVETPMPTSGPTWADVHFADASSGFLVGAVPADDGGDDDWASDGDRGSPSQGTVLRTDDGGASWQVAVSGLAVDLTGVVALPGGRGIVVGYDAGGARAYHTADGGQTLEPATLPTDGEGRGVDYLSAVTAPCGNQAWAVGAIYTDESGETGISAILFSSDGGRTWALDPWPQDFVDGMLDMRQYHTLFDVDFAGPDLGLAGGTEVSVLRYTGEGLECSDLAEDPAGGGDGGGGCSCGEEGETTAARSAVLPALALGALAALRIRRR